MIPPESETSQNQGIRNSNSKKVQSSVTENKRKTTQQNNETG